LHLKIVKKGTAAFVLRAGAGAGNYRKRSRPKRSTIRGYWSRGHAKDRQGRAEKKWNGGKTKKSLGKSNDSSKKKKKNRVIRVNQWLAQLKKPKGGMGECHKKRGGGWELVGKKINVRGGFLHSGQDRRWGRKAGGSHEALIENKYFPKTYKKKKRTRSTRPGGGRGDGRE